MLYPERQTDFGVYYVSYSVNNEGAISGGKAGGAWRLSLTLNQLQTLTQMGVLRKACEICDHKVMRLDKFFWFRVSDKFVCVEMNTPVPVAARSKA